MNSAHFAHSARDIFSATKFRLGIRKQQMVTYTTSSSKTREAESTNTIAAEAETEEEKTIYKKTRHINITPRSDALYILPLAAAVLDQNPSNGTRAGSEYWLYIYKKCLYEAIWDSEVVVGTGVVILVMVSNISTRAPPIPFLTTADTGATSSKTPEKHIWVKV